MSEAPPINGADPWEAIEGALIQGDFEGAGALLPSTAGSDRGWSERQEGDVAGSLIRLFTGQGLQWAWLEGERRAPGEALLSFPSEGDWRAHLRGERRLGLRPRRSGRVRVVRRRFEGSGAGPGIASCLTWRRLLDEADRHRSELRRRGAAVLLEAHPGLIVDLWRFAGPPGRPVSLDRPRPSGLAGRGAGRDAWLAAPLSGASRCASGARLLDGLGSTERDPPLALSRIEAALQGDGGLPSDPSPRISRGDPLVIDRALARCLRLDVLVRRARLTGRLRPLDRVALIHTLAHLGEAGAALVEDLLIRSGAEGGLTGRRKGRPASCATLREWLPAQLRALPCRCHSPPPTWLLRLPRRP